MSCHRPPRVATWLLGCFLPELDREAVLGDLVEEYGIRVRSASISNAAGWYWSQVWRSIPPVLWIGIRRGAWLSTVGVAIGAYIVAGMIEFVSVAAMARLFNPVGQTFPVLSVIVGLATMVLGGYLAAWIRPAAATVLAAIVIIVIVVLFVTMRDSAPLWYGFTFLIFGPVAALAGGTLCRVRRTGRAGWYETGDDAKDDQADRVSLSVWTYCVLRDTRPRRRRFRESRARRTRGLGAFCT